MALSDRSVNKTGGNAGPSENRSLLITLTTFTQSNLKIRPSVFVLALGPH